MSLNQIKRSNKFSSLTLIEFLIALCLISVLAGVFIYFAGGTLRAGREEALRNELGNIRMSIELYRVINERFPENLIELMNQNLTLENDKGILLEKEYLRPFRTDKEGHLLDPFMSRYAYNMKTGVVKSQTTEYQDW